MSFRKPMFRRVLAGLTLTAVVAFAAGCSDSSGPDGDVYKLFSVDGETVPITETFSDGVVTLKSGTVTLNNGKYTVRFVETWDPTVGTTETYVYGENGTYEEADGEITFTPTHDFEDGELFEVEFPETSTATRTDTELTAEVDGIIFIFRK
jgi:hypothetical protein